MYYVELRDYIDKNIDRDINRHAETGDNIQSVVVRQDTENNNSSIV